MLGIGALALWGCGGGDGRPDAGFGPAATRAATVTLAAGPGASLAAAAWFLQARGLAPERLRLAIDGLEADDDAAPLDQCERVDVAEGLAALLEATAAPGAEALLLDAGDLALRVAPGGEALLSPRPFPELLPPLGGVVYREPLEGTAEPGALVTLSSTGSEEIGPFEATGAWPAAPRIERALAGGDGAPASVRWDAAGAGPRDVVTVALGVGDGPPRLRCRARDDGAFEAPAAGATWVELVRARRIPFWALGLDGGELRLEQRERAALEPRER